MDSGLTQNRDFGQKEKILTKRSGKRPDQAARIHPVFVLKLPENLKLGKTLAVFFIVLHKKLPVGLVFNIDSWFFYQRGERFKKGSVDQQIYKKISFLKQNPGWNLAKIFSFITSFVTNKLPGGSKSWIQVSLNSTPIGLANPVPRR